MALVSRPIMPTEIKVNVYYVIQQILTNSPSILGRADQRRLLVESLPNSRDICTLYSSVYVLYITAHVTWNVTSYSLLLRLHVHRGIDTDSYEASIPASKEKIRFSLIPCNWAPSNRISSYLHMYPGANLLPDSLSLQDKLPGQWGWHKCVVDKSKLHLPWCKGLL